MGNIVENPVWEETVFQIETTTPLLGGSPEKSGFGTPTAGYLNVAQQQLANRTQYLKDALDNTDIDVGGLSDRVDTVETNLTAHIGSRGASHTNATQTEAGFMSAADKTKLNGVETGAQVNVATNLAQGTRTATTVPVTSSTGTSATLAVATTSLAGVMSSADKTKLDSVLSFSTVSVAGQSDVVADAVSDTLTLVAGTNVTLTTDSTTDTITINASAAADTTKVAKTGDTMTGPLVGTQVRMASFIDKTVTISSSTGSVALDCSLGSIFDLTLTGNTAISFTNVPSLSSETYSPLVIVRQGASAFSFSLPSGSTPVTPGGAAIPTPAANKRADFIFATRNGTSWDVYAGAAT